MKRLESNLLNMILSLTVVALFAAALLGGLYVLTAEPIALQKAQKQQLAIAAVLPAAEAMEVAPADTVNNLILYRAYADNNLIGTAVEVEENGFGGKFRLMVGFTPEGDIVNYEVLEHQETPGLGDKMGKWFKTDKKRQSVIGKNPSTTHFIVSKDAGGEVDAITAATISSRAFLRAVQHAYDAQRGIEVEAVTGATWQQPTDITNEQTEVEPTDNNAL